MYEIYCQLRDAAGVTDYKVAKETGVSRSAFTDWKKGESKPKRENMEKIAQYFGVPVEYLITGKHAAKTSDSGKQYYFSDETAEMAQRIFDDPTLRALFDATRGLTPDALAAVEKVLRKMKVSNPDG